MATVRGAPVVYVEKHPSAAKRLVVDWTNFAASSVVSNAAWTDASPSPSGISLSGDAVAGKSSSVLVADGTDGKTAYLENIVTFSDGRVEVLTFCMQVTSKVPLA